MKKSEVIALIAQVNDPAVQRLFHALIEDMPDDAPARNSRRRSAPEPEPQPEPQPEA